MTAFQIFAIATIVNVILSTMRSIATIKGNALIASFMSAVAYGFYTWVVVLTSIDNLTLFDKIGITFLANFVGVFIVKFCEKKLAKDKLWKIDFTILAKKAEGVIAILEEENIPYCYNEYGKHIMFSAFCEKQKDTRFISELVKELNGKYFVSENKSILK